MVEKDLLHTTALDLGITRYSTESDAQFHNRVIYSAMACWIKAACQDRPVEGDLFPPLSPHRYLSNNLLVSTSIPTDFNKESISSILFCAFA